MGPVLPKVLTDRRAQNGRLDLCCCSRFPVRPRTCTGFKRNKTGPIGLKRDVINASPHCTDGRAGEGNKEMLGRICKLLKTKRERAREATPRTHGETTSWNVCGSCAHYCMHIHVHFIHIIFLWLPSPPGHLSGPG